MLFGTDIPILMTHQSDISNRYDFLLSINSFALYKPPSPPKPEPIVSVSKSNVVLASNIHEKLSDDLLSMFFKSQMKCGGGEYDKPMDIDRSHGTALIFYRDCEGKFCRIQS